MHKKLWFIILTIVLVIILARLCVIVSYIYRQNPTVNGVDSKADESYVWQDIFKNKPVLTLLGKCEAPDGEGGIDLEAYNPKDTDGKEKFGPLQFDEDTFYGKAKQYNLFEVPDIHNSIQQILLAEVLIANHEHLRWPTCWNRIFPR